VALGEVDDCFKYLYKHSIKKLKGKKSEMRTALFTSLFASLAICGQSLQMAHIWANTSETGSNSFFISSTAGAIRAVLNTGSPATHLPTGTAIYSGQMAAIRFTAPPDVSNPGSRLLQIEVILRSGNVDSQARFTVVEDSGRNFPGISNIYTNI
jgi:hypothetical protein